MRVAATVSIGMGLASGPYVCRACSRPGPGLPRKSVNYAHPYSLSALAELSNHQLPLPTPTGMPPQNRALALERHSMPTATPWTDNHTRDTRCARMADSMAFNGSEWHPMCSNSGLNSTERTQMAPDSMAPINEVT